MQASDAEWVLAAVRRYEGPLLMYVGRLLGNSEQARDVVQDAFLRLCRQTRGEVEDKLAAWLFTVCRNRVRDLQRKDVRMSAATQVDLDGRPSAAPDPADAAELSETKGNMLASLARLPEREQEVLRLKFQNDFSYKEIADVTGLSVGNVGFLIHNGIRRLRQLMTPAHS